MIHTLALTAFGLALGIGLGLVHFATLKRVAALYVSAASPARAFGLQLARLAVLALALLLLARLGAAPLIASALGLTIARGLVLRRTGKEA